MDIRHEISKGVGKAFSTVHAGAEKLARVKLAGNQHPTLSLSSSAFGDGGPLPRSCTADGVGVPPPLAWTAAPAGTRSLVLICEDPDAPKPEPYVHWLVYGIPADVSELTSHGLPRTREGKNSKLHTGFTPAAPPPGHGVHHYHFQLFALDTPVNLPTGASKDELLDAMEGHMIAFGDLVGTYQRH